MHLIKAKIKTPNEKCNNEWTKLTFHRKRINGVTLHMVLETSIRNVSKWCVARGSLKQRGLMPVERVNDTSINWHFPKVKSNLSLYELAVLVSVSLVVQMYYSNTLLQKKREIISNCMQYSFQSSFCWCFLNPKSHTHKLIHDSEQNTQFTVIHNFSFGFFASNADSCSAI